MNQWEYVVEEMKIEKGQNDEEKQNAYIQHDVGAANTMSYIVKDSGIREEYASGMVCDTQQGKPNFAQ